MTYDVKNSLRSVVRATGGIADQVLDMVQKRLGMAVEAMTTRRRLIPLSQFDQSLVETLSLVRLFYYKRLPESDRLRSSFADALTRFPRFASEIVRSDGVEVHFITEVGMVS